MMRETRMASLTTATTVFVEDREMACENSFGCPRETCRTYFLGAWWFSLVLRRFLRVGGVLHI